MNDILISQQDTLTSLNNAGMGASQESLKEKQALLAAVQGHLAATAAAAQAKVLGDSNDPSSDDGWPYDPTQPIPDFPFDPSSTDPNQVYLNWEQALSWIQNNPDNINGYIAFLQATTAVGQVYNNLTPDQQTQFNNTIKDFENGSPGQSFAKALSSLMWGALYQDFDKDGKAGFDKANSFCQMLLNSLAGAAPNDEFFRRLAKDINSTYQDIQNAEANDCVPVTDANGNIIGYQMVDSNGNPIDYAAWEQKEVEKLGTFFDPSNEANFQSLQNLLYGAAVDNIMAAAKNPWEAMIMILSLLIGGPDQDIARQINGTSHTMDVLSGQGDILHQILQLMTEGNFKDPTQGPQDAQKLMSLMSQLQHNVDSNPLLAQFAPEFDSAINSFMQLGGTIPIGSSGTSAQINLSQGQYNFTVPQGVTSITVVEDGKTITYNNLQPGQTVSFNLGNSGGTMQFTAAAGTTSIAVPIGELGFSSTLNSQTGGFAQFQMGDFGDLSNSLAALQGSTQAGDIATSFSSLISLLQSPNSNLQNEVGTLTNTKTTLEGMMKAAYQVITNVDDTALKALQNAGN